MEIIIILLLIIINGIFAMSEIAIVSARKSKLQQRAQDGDKKAQNALALAKSPNKFLSTVQIGITLIGIITGAFGGKTIADPLSHYFESLPFFGPYADTISLAIVVSVITFLSVVLGELVPKRLALSNPEKIASFMAGPMNLLSRVSSPLVTILSMSTEWLFRILRISPSNEPTVSDEEIRILLREGAQSGVFEHVEKDIVERTMRLSDKKVNRLMTPRKEIIWLDIDSPFKVIRSKLTKNPHAHFPVCRGTIDKVVGIAQTKSLLTDFLAEEKIDLKKILHKPLFIPESMSGLRVLELFKKSGIHMALIIDEYGNIKGLLSITDVLEAIVGDIPTINEMYEKDIIKRKDGTFLVDGLTPIDELKDFFKIKKLPGERSGLFQTAGGFTTSHIGRIPLTGDIFSLDSIKFEIVDMDGNRVDKILITPIGKKQ